MTKEVAKKEKAELQNLELNFFEEFGSQSQTAIVGKLLKFSKGDWLAGQDEEEIPDGTKLVANMEQLLVGWVKWADNKPEQQIMGPLHEGHKPQPRSTLGDSDESQWEQGPDGRARDPWQFTIYMLMAKPGADFEDSDDLFTFTTSSKGGINAVQALSKVYGKHMRMNPGEFPIVELHQDSYPHPDFGRVKYPVFDIVGWQKQDAATAAVKKSA